MIFQFQETFVKDQKLHTPIFKIPRGIDFLVKLDGVGPIDNRPSTN